MRSNNNMENMEVIKMVNFEKGEKYPLCDEQDNFNDFWEFKKNTS
jgi:hypothetical protein